ncbi:hypothetical protein KFL_004560110 [Klebsormidium nitens]|uniref:Uncharacterized protein n=1 Tax=Klebsormidium nitens TaxID=105231 RepID=A0A1Y1ICV9_KLENI|nr:hypothetical protein KFL_004560110 [Klebsormidium nitens]|eukprot:GAQ88750.1 hypothetical protein KFL_004560110 [Klebsormidium nitens]
MSDLATAMDPDQVYLFRISVDVRNFRALRRLPLPVAAIYVKVLFPREIVQLAAEGTAKQPGASVAALTAPLRTHPPQEVARQTEVALTNGFVALELPATILAMATALARGAKLVAEVYHRDRYTADRLLGRGTVPLAALLEEPWLDGYVPMLASKAVRTQRGTPPAMERVAVGSLRLVLLIEELGPAVGPARVKRRSEAAIRPEVPPSAAEDLPWPEAEGGVELPEYAGSVYASDAEEKQEGGSAAWASTPGSRPAALARDQDANGEGREEVERRVLTDEVFGEAAELRKEVQGGSGLEPEAKVVAEASGLNGIERTEGDPDTLEQRAQRPVSRSATPTEVRIQDRRIGESGRAESDGVEAAATGSRADGEGQDAVLNGGNHGAGTPAGIREGAEYEAAWALEMWKRSEESKFMAELKEREAARMAALEEEWKKREKERVAEVAAVRAEHAVLGAKLEEQLASLAGREKKLLAAEEAASTRREALERDHAHRTADAKAAIKRLKEECEHQLQLERSRYEELARQKKGLEERLSATEAARARLEREFAEHRAAQRGTPEAELAAQVVALQQKNLDLQRSAEKATAAKKQYKAQVLRMARELAAMHRQQAADEAARLAKERRRLEARALASTAKEEADRARDERLELVAIKEQLARLQDQEQASAAATAAALRALALDRVVSGDEAERAAGSQRRKKQPAAAGAPGTARRRKQPPRTRKEGQVDALEAAEAKLRRGSVRREEQANEMSGSDSGMREKGIDWPALQPVDDPPDEARCKDEVDAPAFVGTMSQEELRVKSLRIPDQDVIRLLRERAALLRTGVYQRGDKVIIALEKEIEKRSGEKHEV